MVMVQNKVIRFGQSATLKYEPSQPLWSFSFKLYIYDWNEITVWLTVWCRNKEIEDTTEAVKIVVTTLWLKFKKSLLFLSQSSIDVRNEVNCYINSYDFQITKSNLAAFFLLNGVFKIFFFVILLNLATIFFYNFWIIIVHNH